MANGVSAYATALIATPSTRNVTVNYQDYHSRRQLRKDVITVLGNEASTAYHDLGPVLRDGTFLIPEESRMRFNNVGNLSTTLTLQRVYAAAVPLAATWTRATTVQTYTTLVKHNFIVGQVVSLSAASDVSMLALGSVTIALVTSDTTFTITVTPTGAASGTATIGVVAGGVQALTTAVAAGVGAATCGSAGIVFVPVTGGPSLPLLLGERLRLEFTLVTTVTAGRLIYLELAFDAPTS